jgi:uncharacterized protein (TIGR03790 family)
MKRGALALLLGAGLAPLAFALPAAAQTGENILLVVNQASEASVQIGDYYARRRGVPRNNVLGVTVAPKDEVSRSDFERHIETPITTWFGRSAAHDRVVYIVLTKGVPLRVTGTTGRSGTVASVDSELALQYRKMTGTPVPVAGPLPNPYFLGDRAIEQARPFSHREQDIFLVTRLDGFTVDDAIGLVDRGLTASRDGRFVLDGRAGSNERGNEWLKAAADWLTAHGFADRVVSDMTGRALRDEKNVLGYYSWGSSDPALKLRRFNLAFVPGAIGAMFVSGDARTFTEPPADWTIGTWEAPKSYFAGSPQSLTGDLIREGITGVAGHVADPYLDGTIRPDFLFPAYVSGFNLAESYYLAMPYLSWQTVVVGDPLCAAFPRRTPTTGELDPAPDSATELPGFFSLRRLKAASASLPDVQPEAVRLFVRGESRMSRDDLAGARESIEKAVAADERLIPGQLLLAFWDEQNHDTDAAIARYKRILAVDPNHVVSLNNLAYQLAVHKNQPSDALALAERARRLTGSNPALAGSVSDTLGWIQHLLGNEREAIRWLAEAVRLVPANPEIRLHAALAYAAGGQLDASLAELTRAVELAPDFEGRDEVKQLRARLRERRKE